MMPVRDLVIFPQMMNPFIVGRESSLRALEEALATDKKIFLATQHDASVDDPETRRNLHRRHARQYRAKRAPAGRQFARAGRRRRTRQSRASHHGRRLFPRRAESDSQQSRAFPADRAGRHQGHRPVRAVREALAEPELRHHDRRDARRRPREAFRHHRVQPADSGRGKTGTARKFRSAGPPDAASAKFSKAKSKSSTSTATSTRA